MSASFRAAVLNEAKGYITQDRNTSYGEPEDNFSNIAEIWNAQGVSVGGRPVSAVDVALMMVGMKLARLKNNPTHRDSYVDAAGYIACGAEIALDKPTPDIVLTGLGEPIGVGMAMTDIALDEGVHFCGSRNEHEGHNYTRSSSGAVLWAGADYWCDGYINQLKRNQAEDVATVKRVADNMNGERSRPVVDAPQA